MTIFLDLSTYTPEDNYLHISTLEEIIYVAINGDIDLENWKIINCIKAKQERISYEEDPFEESEPETENN